MNASPRPRAGLASTNHNCDCLPRRRTRRARPYPHARQIRPRCDRRARAGQHCADVPEAWWSVGRATIQTFRRCLPVGCLKREFPIAPGMEACSDGGSTGSQVAGYHIYDRCSVDIPTIRDSCRAMNDREAAVEGAIMVCEVEAALKRLSDCAPVVHARDAAANGIAYSFAGREE